MATEHQTLMLIIMLVYTLVIIGLGLYQGRKVKTDSDFAIASRDLPGWAAALSERATGESSWALLGLPGAAYATGLLEIWTAIGCVAGVITAWVVLAWRLQKAANKYKVNTFIDYISKHHSESAKIIRVLGSLTIVFFFFFYVGAQFLGGGKTLFSMFNIRPEIGMLLVAIIVVPYTIYGGFRSVVYTDVIQAIIMVITLIVGPIAGVYYLTNNPELTFFANGIGEAIVKAGPEYSSLTGASKGFLGGVVIVGGFSWFFGYLGGQPQLSMRFMAIKDKKQAIQARNIGVIWTIIAYLGALAIGWLGIAIFGPNAFDDQEFIMPAVITTVFPPAIAGILITGVLAAIVSTANSLLIVSSTELSDNIFKYLSPKFSDPKLSLKMSRWVTAILAVIALCIAYYSYSPIKIDDKVIISLKHNNIPGNVIAQVETLENQVFYDKKQLENDLEKIIDSENFKEYGALIISSAKKENTLIFTMVSYVWAGIGGTFSVVILLSLFWKAYHGRAVVITILTGLIFTILWISTGLDKVFTSRILTFVVAGAVAIAATFLVPVAKRE